MPRTPSKRDPRRRTTRCRSLERALATRALIPAFAPLFVAALVAVTGGCRTPSETLPPATEAPATDAPAAVATAAAARVETWGTMREALRMGESGPRVDLAGLAAHDAIGVGALAGLAGEVTIADGRVRIATVDGLECVVTDAPADAAATLLVRAEVAGWERRRLPDTSTYAELEEAIAAALEHRSIDTSEPVPVRLHGRAERVAYHVIDGACPVANPSGNPPWRFAGTIDDVEFVGFFVEGGAGQWTHHDRRSHLHVLTPERTGHLDEVSIRDTVLLVPLRDGAAPAR